MRIAFCAVLSAGFLAAQTLPGTLPYTLQGDPASEMVEGITRYLVRETQQRIPQRRPSRERLRKILGVVDPRVPFAAPHLSGTVRESALLTETPAYRVFAVRWPVIGNITAEGLLFEPTGKTVARVVVIPDADQLPEEFRVSQRLAASGCQVLSPVLISREDTLSGNPRIRMTNQPHREFVYRMAFMVGRHVYGYEVQKALAAVDWFAAQEPKLPVGAWGFGEGGAVALFAAALDERIDTTVVSGYFEPREGLWLQPLDRNVFGLLKDFGDGELAAMTAPRRLIVETAPGPSWSGPAAETPQRRGAAPGRLQPAPGPAVDREFRRAQALAKGANLEQTANALQPFLRSLHADARTVAETAIPVRDGAARQRRQLQEVIDFTQELARRSEDVRYAAWAKTEKLKPEEWEKLAPAYQKQLWDDSIGRLPKRVMPLQARTRKAYNGAKWDGYDVAYDVLPDVFGSGVLLVPKNIPSGERRPVIVAQHGLEGRPQHLFGLAEVEQDNGRATNFHYYQNIGSKLADLGYVVYMPQNPYIGDFRKINRLANPLGWSLFSFILAQHDTLLDWLSSLPFVDPARMGFYGLSYGGKTAVRVPPLLQRYALSICSGDFNEWIFKVVTTEARYSYMFTHEYEIPEFDLAHVANHAEMAKMMAPRPFMVERGHRDGVGVDEWVAYEYAKVKRFYDEMGIGDRTEFEYFNGPHKIHAVGTIAFIRKHFGL